jgi:hypothetical protein
MLILGAGRDAKRVTKHIASRHSRRAPQGQPVPAMAEGR